MQASQRSVKPKVLIAVLTTHERYGWVHPSILSFCVAVPWEPYFRKNVVLSVNANTAAAARNRLCRDFLDSDADWICMIDNDMEVPDNLLETIKDAPADAGIVAPMFWFWDGDKQRPIICWNFFDEAVNKGDKTISLEPGFMPIRKCGSGVIFIRREVLRKLDYPWFRYLYNEEQARVGTEDVWFTQNAFKAGVKIYGNTLVQCGHHHTIDIRSLVNYQCQLDKLRTECGMALDTV